MGRKEGWGRLDFSQGPVSIGMWVSFIPYNYQTDQTITILNKRRRRLRQVDVQNLWLSLLGLRHVPLVSAPESSNWTHFLTVSTRLMPKYQSQNPNAMLSMLRSQIPGFYITLKTNNWVPWTLRFPTWLFFCRWPKPGAAFSCTQLHPCHPRQHPLKTHTHLSSPF